MVNEKNGRVKNGKQNNQKKQNGEKQPKLDLHPETKKSVWGVVFFTIAAVTLMAYFGVAGRAGAYLYQGLHALLGVGYFLVPLSLVMIAVGFFRSLKTDRYFASVFGGALFLVSFLGLLDALNRGGGGVGQSESYVAGYVGFLISYPFLYLFGFWVTVLLFGVAALIAVSVAFNAPLWRRRGAGEDAAIETGAPITTIEDLEKENSGFFAKAIGNGGREKTPAALSIAQDMPLAEKKKSPDASGASSQKVAEFIIETHQAHYQIPPIDLLEKDSQRPNSGDVDAYALVIQKTLAHFGIEVEMGEVNVGPTVTQYTLKPAQGIKLARIVALQNDLALSLAAHPLRIEAPIPGRSLVGIEVPNKVVALVRLRNLIDSPAFAQAPPLTVALGRDVSGNPQYADIEKMPHLLIAGSTGSGKSVCVHTIMTSLLYKNFPQMLKFLIIDPKRVELVGYNNIPHLLAPVIVERSKALGALRWAVKEMERRYEFLAQFKVRNIGSYNAQIAKGKGDGDNDILPYIIIVIDELADLMATSAKEAEATIVRLAQMSRAVGMHLVISTQRPSVEVITGLIKANIPCRIAFQVSSLVDSRTILDMSGAEKLVGNGDMLYLPQDIGKPRRIQGAFVSEKEVKKITEYIVRNAIDAEAEQIAAGVGDSIAGETAARQTSIDLDAHTGAAGDAGEDEELLQQAKQVVAQAQKASTSLLQRRLKLGYARAARIMDMLEEAGHIGPADGAKPREVYLTPEDTAHNDEL